MSTVSILQVSDYQQSMINEAVNIHCERLHLREQLSPNTKVLLKPNLLMKRTPSEFTTTHPAVVEAMAIWLKSIGITRIVLADSPGGPYSSNALKGIYRTCGMTQVCERQGITLNDDTTYREMPSPGGKLVTSFPIITPVCDADFIIDLCKLKTHAMTGLSGAVKNMFGTIPGLTKPVYHSYFPDKKNFCRMLIDLCETTAPDFILVDAIEAMEGNGPSGGTMKPSGLLLASDNPYDMDFTLCHIMGIDPKQIFTVSESILRGLCAGTLDGIELIGELPLSSPFRLPNDISPDFTSKLPIPFQRPAAAFINRFLTAKPRIQKARCIGCKKCAESCPQKIIHIENGKAVISYKNCIRCYCCHEMCPVKAIEIKR